MLSVFFRESTNLISYKLTVFLFVPCKRVTQLSTLHFSVSMEDNNFRS